MKRRRLLVFAAAIAFCFLLLLAFTPKPPRTPSASVQFIAYTTNASGVRSARFEIRNLSRRDITRYGYCWINGEAVDFPSSKKIRAGHTETLDFPLVPRSGVQINRVRHASFIGTRDLNIFEEAAAVLHGALETLGLKADGLGAAYYNFWEVHVKVEADSNLAR